MRNFTLCLASFTCACQSVDEQTSDRADRADDASGSIIVGVVWPEKVDLFWEGITLAEERIAKMGGVSGRPLEVRRRGDAGSLTDAKTVAQELSDDLDVVAVIGHRDDDAARAVSVLYEFTDMIMLAPGTASARLLRPGFSRVFQVAPTDDAIGASLADYAMAHDLRRISVILSNDLSGRTVANAFESRAEAHRIQIVERISVDRGSVASLERALARSERPQAQAVLLAAHLADARDLLTTLRASGVVSPVLAPSSLDASSILDVPAAEGTVIATVFDAGLSTPEVIDFVTGFEAKNEKKPDTAAAQAYVALRILADAMQRAESTVPGKVAKALRVADGFKHATGSVRFDALGKRVEPSIIYKRVSKGAFEIR